MKPVPPQKALVCGQTKLLIIICLEDQTTQINYAKQAHNSMKNIVSIMLAVVFTDALVLTPFSLQLSKCAHMVTFIMREKDGNTLQSYHIPPNYCTKSLE